jgi:hypothetical protein
MLTITLSASDQARRAVFLSWLQIPRPAGVFQTQAGNREIADLLSLSEHTVKNYLFHIFNKLGISNRVELVLDAVSNPKGSTPASPQPEKSLPNSLGRGT